jgi:glycosyltransferase involved in cell wall biosynthesis
MHIAILVPVFNHSCTLRNVVQKILFAHHNVIVIDDGSTDLLVTHPASPEHPLYEMPITYLRHSKNLGKGAAIMTGATEARCLGMTHIITIDADGQHDPTELSKFVEASENNPNAIFVGLRDFSSSTIPFSSRFGRSFSNFWYKVHTGHDIGDVQSGFRLYPLTVFDAIVCNEKRYSFEVEVLVRASWAGFVVEDIPISVFYPDKSKRISHFRPIMDNMLISLLNTRLTVRSIMPWPQKKFVQDKNELGRINPLHPLRSMRILLMDNATPKNLALSSAAGVGIGILPLLGLHSILIILFCSAWKLNKIMALAISQLCMPPLTPAICIEIGYFLCHGTFLTEISWKTLGYEAFDRLVEWLLGSLVLSPACALLFGFLTFGLALAVKKGLEKATSTT